MTVLDVDSQGHGCAASSTRRCVVVEALALIHHIAISGNVPLDRVVAWLTSLAPRGVIEFVPKSDPMVIELLRLREDIFADYNEESFARSLHQRARIVASDTVSASGRKLFAFERTTAT